MHAPLRHLFVIVLSFAVVIGSGLATYGVWLFLGGVQSLERGVIALLSWVGTFYIGAVLFWRTLVRLTPVN